MNYLETAKASLGALRGRPDRSTATERSESARRPTAEQVTAMRLEEFAQAGLVLRVYSEVLGCRVLFVSDNVRDSDLAGEEGPPVYRVDELRKLAVLRPSAEQLRRIDEPKRIFKGTIEEVERPHEPGEGNESGPKGSEKSEDAR